MAKSINNNSPIHMVSDLILAMFAVAIVGGTFIGLNTLSPILRNEKEVSAVLGAQSTEEQLLFFPAISTAPFINESQLSIDTSKDSGASLAISFNQLEKTTYEFSIITIKNNSGEYKTIQIVPQYSLFNSFITISLVTADTSTVLLDAQGQVFPIDYVISPNTSITLKLFVQPAEKIATPTKFMLGFTQRQ